MNNRKARRLRKLERTLTYINVLIDKEEVYPVSKRYEIAEFEKKIDTVMDMHKENYEEDVEIYRLKKCKKCPISKHMKMINKVMRVNTLIKPLNIEIKRTCNEKKLAYYYSFVLTISF